MNLVNWILAAECALCVLVFIAAFYRSDFQKRAKRSLLLFIAAACVWIFNQIVWQLDWLDSSDVYPLARVPKYWQLLLAALFFDLSHAFLRLEATRRRWWALGLGCGLATLILDLNLFNLADKWWRHNEWYIDRAGISLGVLGVGWGLFMAAAGLNTLNAYRQSRHPLHRNRIKYWVPAWGVILAGGALALAWLAPLGAGLILVGILIAAYAVTTYDLVDVRQFARHILSYLLFAGLASASYAAGLAVIHQFFKDAADHGPLLAGLVMTLVLSLLFQPLDKFSRRLFNRLIFGSSYDPSRMLRQYGANINNVVDLALLANLIIQHISQAMGSQHGQLFLIDRQKDANGGDSFQLHQASSKGAIVGSLPADSLIVDRLHQERQILTQYDIDMRSDLQASCAAECEWLSALNMDVYVPIHSQAEWMGLLALGPKASGDRYFEDDLRLLGALAEQTAIALQNARLVQDLVQANQEIGQAYAALNRANQQLQDLDKLKSAFIGVITHELRTPFANLLFALELLERHGRSHLPSELHEQMDQVNEGVKAAKQMVDNLVTFAIFLSKQGQLHFTELELGGVVQDSLLPLQQMAQNKQITLYVETPDDLPPVRGDHQRLSDAVYHLVQNAIKFTQAGGQVWVRCRTSDKNVHFEVQDTGVGVPADKLPTLWDDFTQMADPLRRGVEGLGLGLALVKYVVNAHSGEVWAESKEDVGSTFGFWLAAAQPEPNPPPAPEIIAPTASQPTHMPVPINLLHDFGGQGPTMHLAHANGFPPATYTPLAETLFDQYHVVGMPARPLWPGSQPQTAPNWHALVDDLIQVLDALGLTGVIGVGHSLGGVCTLLAAVRRPDLFRAVLLIDPVILPTSTLRRLRLFDKLGLTRWLPLVRQARRRRRVWPDRQTCFDSYRGKPLFANWPDESLWAYVQAGTTERADGQVELIYPTGWEAHIFASTPSDVWEHVPQLQVPALFIRGEHTDAFRPQARQQVQSLLPQARFRLILDAGHLAPMERPAEVGAAIQEFLSELEIREKEKTE